ncbi:MAG TPA: ATP-binding protein, partial [Rugosimonospora sp.]|nr:ATP-binding protein [Rugosimonospora sp.]
MVRAALTEAQLTELVDEAQLLTTELATNGILHAHTEIDLEVAVDGDSVIVTVTDFATPDPGDPVPSLTVSAPDELSERGRGLLLVDRFAASWGVVHHETGKGVWFRLSRKAGTPDATLPAAAGPTLAALTALAEADLAGQARWSTRAAGELLSRLRAATGIDGALLELDRADGRGPVGVLEHGARTAGTLRLPLPVARPWRGDLVLYGTGTAYAQPLGALVAAQLGLALENDRLRRNELRRQAAITFLAEVGDLLAQSLDATLTTALIPRLVVPRLGRWCAVWSADEWGEPT